MLIVVPTRAYWRGAHSAALRLSTSSSTFNFSPKIHLILLNVYFYITILETENATELISYCQYCISYPPERAYRYGHGAACMKLNKIRLRPMFQMILIVNLSIIDFFT